MGGWRGGKGWGVNLFQTLSSVVVKNIEVIRNMCPNGNVIVFDKSLKLRVTHSAVKVIMSYEQIFKIFLNSLLMHKFVKNYINKSINNSFMSIS